MHYKGKLSGGKPKIGTFFAYFPYFATPAGAKIIPMPRGCISHRIFVAAVWDFLTDFTDFRGGVLDFSQISQISRIFLRR